MDNELNAKKYAKIRDILKSFVIFKNHENGINTGKILIYEEV